MTFIKKQKLAINSIPFIGIISFVLLFIYSTKLFPGGSQFDLDSKGYDWANNYWCNLMSINALNGDLNPARQYAILGLIILCLSLAFFFYLFSTTFVKDKKWSMLISFGGVLSMLAASLIFTKYHDLMTIVSSLFGLVATLGIIKGIYNSELLLFKITGVICILLLLVNNVIYYTTYGIEWLPIIQKITLVIVLLWIVGLNFQIRKRINSSY